MPNLKKMINRYMKIITLVIVVAILPIVIGVTILNEQYRERESSEKMFYQMEQILEENQRDLDEVIDEYTQTCINNAEGIAYIIQYHPSVLESVEELVRIAEFTEVDEIHIFDKTGCIIMGTHPEYFGVTFDSGEQIGFFKPMLENKELKLCQEITPNTAEGKLMQYSAVWSENQEFIVQIGMEPVNVMRITEKNELSHIFSLLRVNVGVNYYAIDVESGEIVGSTATEDLGKNLTEIGFNLKQLEKHGAGFSAVVNGVNSYCMFTQVDNNFIGRVVSKYVMYQRVPSTVIGLTLCLVLIAVVLVFAVTWYINTYVIAGISGINEKLRAITKGNLDEKADVWSSLEFSELSSHINDMINSLLSNTEKISYVLNKTNKRIGVYEYNPYMSNVRFTEYVPRILALDSDKIKELSSDYKLFREYINKLRENRVEGEEETFFLNGEREIYVKLEEVIRNNNIFGIIIDVTDEILRRRQIEAERDIDSLTGLYNRRGIESKLSSLFKEPEKLGFGALIMIDADGLKDINDIYGHDKGDVYLKKISEVLGAFGLKSCISARQGGDEFILFLYNYDTEEELLKSLETLKFIQDNSSVHLSNDLSVPLRFSFGVSMIKGQTDYQSLLKEADEKMYDNKRERKKNSEIKKCLIR